MALKSPTPILPLLFIFSIATLKVVLAGDPDILTDFILPQNIKSANGSFFSYSGMHHIFDNFPPKTFNVTKASIAEFPALDGQSVSMAVLQFPAGGVNPPHTHPRSAELLFLVGGILEVGFVDTKNVLYTQTMQTGDAFVFPKGLVHFQFNNDSKEPAVAFSSFGSANAGTVSVPVSVFTTGINDEVLAKSFKTDIGTIKKIKRGLSIKH